MDHPMYKILINCNKNTDLFLLILYEVFQYPHTNIITKVKIL